MIIGQLRKEKKKKRERLLFSVTRGATHYQATLGQSQNMKYKKKKYEKMEEE